MSMQERAAIVECLSAEEVEIVREAIEAIDRDGEDLADYDLALTHETIEEFADSAARHWNEVESRAGEAAGEHGRVWWEVQVLRSQPRITWLLVVDVGDRRLVVHP